MPATQNFQRLVLPDGASLAYDILGKEHIGSRIPLILICGMSMLRGDWRELSSSLAINRAVLVYDHRGIGDSSFANAEKDDISIESMARDLNYLIISLGWKEVDLCGMITQQLLFLPYHPTVPTKLLYTVRHIILAATMPAVVRDRRIGVRVPSNPAVYATMTAEQKAALDLKVMKSMFDPEWLSHEDNMRKFEMLMRLKAGGNRPVEVRLAQSKATIAFDFQDFHSTLPDSLPILIIHGEVDSIIPFDCGQDLLQRLPSAQLVPVGSSPGRLPDLKFGHSWWEYFTTEVWSSVLEQFLTDGRNPQINSKL